MIVNAGAIVIEAEEKNNTSITVSTTNPEKLLKILECIKKCGNVGHSFNIAIDPDDNENIKERTFGWDGDGSDRINSISVNESEDVEAGKLSTLIGAASIALLSMFSSIQAGQKEDIKEVENKLIEMQESKSVDALDSSYQDLVRDLSKLSGSNRNKLIDQAEKAHKEMVKKLK